MQLRITTDGVPARESFDVWNAAMFDSLAVSIEPLTGPMGSFTAELVARATGPLLNCSIAADGFRATRHSREIGRQRWDSYWIYRESSPSALYRIAGGELITRPGDLVVADADAPFNTQADRYAFELWRLPKALLDPHLPALRRPLVARLSGQSGMSALAASYLDTLTRNWDGISEAAMGPVAATLGRLIGIACGGVADEQSDAVRAGRLTEARQYIDRHLADLALSPASTAAALHISVRALHLLFEPSDTTFARYVLRRRLEECRSALLANPTRPVIDVALGWGFNSLSNFYRSFRAAFGMAPGDLRAVPACRDGS